MHRRFRQSLARRKADLKVRLYMASIAYGVGLVAWLFSGTNAFAGAADVERGKRLFDQCAACHGLDDQTDTDGPTLKGVIGRKAGSLEDYRYSAAMKRSDVTWTTMTLDAYIADPQGFIKGNRMAFAGMSDPAERADLIAYIEQATQPSR
jgi:cytochrome c